MGKAFGDLNPSLTFLAARVQRAPRLTERERIANGARTRGAGFAQRPRERAPFESQPISAVQRVDVFICLSGLCQTQAWLHAVEQFVDEELSTSVWCTAGDKSQLNDTHVVPPHSMGALTNPSTRGQGPSGAGWLAASVCVFGSATTIGPQSETPHSRPPSRAQSA